MANVTYKIGLSNSDKQQMKSEITSDVINAVSTRFTPTVGDGEFIGVRFYDGDISGVYVGNAVNLTPSSFDDTDGYTKGSIEDVFPFSGITKVTKNVYFKGTGIQAFDGNGDALVETFAKFPKFYCRYWRGYDDVREKNFVEYDIKATADEAHGFFEHFAFFETTDSQYKDNCLIGRYALANITSAGSTINLSISGYLAVDEVSPETIDNRRGQGNEHIVAEYSLLQWLHYICFADRGYGWGGVNDAVPFTAGGKDLYGYTIPSANDGNKTFDVVNTSPYANLQVGMKVSFTTNEYAAGRHSQVTITAKSVGTTNTTFTYSEDVTGIQGKKLHCVYKVDNGICDDITAMNGVNMNYPAGYRPFVEFYIENPYALRKLWLDGLCYYYGDLRTRNLGDSYQLISNRSRWESIGLPAIPSGWAGFLSSNSEFRDTMGKRKYFGLLTNGLVNGSSTTGCVANNQIQNDNEYCFFAGRSRETQGGISSMASCNLNAWSNLASHVLNYGCWARVYWNARRENNP